METIRPAGDNGTVPLLPMGGFEIREEKMNDFFQGECCLPGMGLFRQKELGEAKGREEIEKNPPSDTPTICVVGDNQNPD